GWPFLLLPGILLGVPWLINPLIGAATLFVLYRLGRKHFSNGAANIGLLSLLFNPFFILNSGSHFSHSSCLLMIALCYHFFFNWLDVPDSKRDAALMGLFAGLAFLIRPLPMVGLLAPIGIHVLIHLGRRKWPKNELPALLAS